MKALPSIGRVGWALAAVLLFAAIQGQCSGRAAREEAIWEQGRVVELERQRTIAQEGEARAWAAYTAQVDTSAIYRDSLAAVRAAEASRRAVERAAHAEAVARFDALVAELDTAWVPRAEVDPIVQASREKDATAAAQIASLEITVATLEADTTQLAWDWREADAGWRHSREVVIPALAAERDSYRRQAEAWQRAANPSWFSRAGKIGTIAAVGYGAFRLVEAVVR